MSKSFIIFAMLLTAAMLRAQQPLNPAALGTGSLTADSVPTRSNTMSFGMTVANIFDDNATDPTNTAHALSDNRISVQPQVSLDIQRNRWLSRLSYAPGYTYSSNINAYNSTGQAAGSDVQWSLSKRLSLHFIGAFSSTRSGYENVQLTSELPSIGILNRPNASVIGTNIQNKTEQSQLDFTYQLGRHTSMGIGGSFADLTYQTPSASPQSARQHSRAWTGNAFYSHQFTPRYSFGFQYSARTSNSAASSGLFSLLSHQAVGFLSATLNQKITFTLFGGPEFSRIENSYVPNGFTSRSNPESFTGGAILNIRAKRNGLSASFIQQVSDSGLNGAGSVLVRTAQVELQRQIRPRLTFHMFGNFVMNEQLDDLSPLSLANFASAGMTFSRQITPRLTLSLSGMRQQTLGTSGQTLSTLAQHSHDVATISLSYDLVRPIGR